MKAIQTEAKPGLHRDQSIICRAREGRRGGAGKGGKREREEEGRMRSLTEAISENCNCQLKLKP